jgi:hypothetical protein
MTGQMYVSDDVVVQHVMTWQDSWLTVVESTNDTWHCSSEWLGATWPNQRLPRGTPVFVNLVLVSKVLESTGFEPVTSPYVKAFVDSDCQRTIVLVLVICTNSHVFKVNVLCIARGVGSGLSPDPRFYVLYGTTPFNGRKCKQLAQFQLLNPRLWHI